MYILLFFWLSDIPVFVTKEWENYGLFSLTLVNSFKKNILEGQRYGMSFDFMFIDSGETS
jgi:hypothetical protein